jgi:O-antigen ligase
MTIVLSLLGISFFALITYFLWVFARFEWLAKLTALLVISLPFERIPSISLGGSNIRFSQLLVVFGLFLVAVLWIKKDQRLLSHELNKYNYFWMAFIVLSIPSWFFVTDLRRFLVTEIGTLIVFGAFFLLSQFTVNIAQRLKDLVNAMIFVTLFGYYQFVADLVGFPTWATGLRETYTKIVFGIPRIHATAIEPLYFAGMLFVCLFLSLSYFFLNKPLLDEKIVSWFRLEKKSNYMINGFLFMYFLLVFLLTISKSAIVIFVAILPFFIFFLTQIFEVHLLELAKKLWASLSLIMVLALGIYAFSPSIQSIFDGIYVNFVDTIYGNSASSGERAQFLKAFDHMIDNHIVLGIGSGHFGVDAGDYIPFETGTDNYLIVNNVYLEVWLEHGLLPVLIFITLIIALLIKFMVQIVRRLHADQEQSCIQISLFFAFLAYCFQWLTFSPIFIMPIFIIMGLIAREISAQEM